MELITINILSFTYNLFKTCRDIFIGAVGSLLAVFIIWQTTRIFMYFRNRSFNNFWQDLSLNKISIIYPEYNPIGTDESSRRIRNLAGKVLSKGTAMAIHELLSLLRKHQYSFNLIGSESGSDIANNHIILGGPGSNPYSASMFRVLHERYEMPIFFINEGLNYYIKIRDDLSLVPNIEGNSGTDYAVIIKANHSSDTKRFVVIAAGCSMYGTWAAAKAACDPSFIRSLKTVTGKSHNIVAILKIELVNGVPVNFDLCPHIEDNLFCLIRKHTTNG